MTYLLDETDFSTVDANRSSEIIYRAIAVALTRDVGEFARVAAVDT